MKHIITLLAVLSSVVAFAEEAPPALKDAKIVVTLKDGKQYSFPASAFKVVPRLDKVEAKPVAAPVKEAAPSLASIPAIKPNKNRVRLLGGVGPTDLNSKTNTSSVVIESKNGAVGGASYDRLITDRVSLGGQVLTNGTYLLGVGLDF